MTVKIPPAATPDTHNGGPALAIEDGDAWLDSDDLDKILPGSRTSKKRWRRRPDPALALPQPIQFSEGGRNYWRLSWIRDWQRRVAEHCQAKHGAAHSGAHGEGG